MCSSSRSLLRYFALPGFDRLFGGGIDPPGLEPDGVFRRGGGTSELVPMGDAERRDVVMRDQVIAILQYSVEGMRVSHQARSVGRPDQILDQLVDGFAFDAHQVAASLLVGGLRAPII